VVPPQYSKESLVSHLASMVSNLSIQSEDDGSVVHLTADTPCSKLVSVLVKNMELPYDHLSSGVEAPLSIAAGEACTDNVLALLELGAGPDGGVVSARGGGEPSKHFCTATWSRS
jgi:hypothetical protein